MHVGRRKGKSRQRILYWFRTPPGVRVGRAALDEDAIRLIEQSNPDVDFDWVRILKGQPDPKAPEPRETRPERPSRHEKGRRPDRPAPEAVVPKELERELPERPAEASREDAFPAEAGSHPTDAEEPRTAAFERLGSEGLARLRARYAEVLARISERITDPERQEQLKAEAERLNPDTWVTDADVAAGLEAYEPTWEALRSVVGGGGRRRRRKRRRGGAQPGTTPSGLAPEGPADERDEPGADGEPGGGGHSEDQ